MAASSSRHWSRGMGSNDDVSGSVVMAPRMVAHGGR